MMKNFLCTLLLAASIFYTSTAAYALSEFNLEMLLNETDLKETASISVSVRDADTGIIVYKKDDKKLLHPASSLKLFTAYAAFDTLGYDYNFKTQFYKSNGDLYIKLGADPFLTLSQLKSAFDRLKSAGYNSFKNLYIDDSIIDKNEFAQGWMYEDDASPYTPKVSSYNLDGNVIKAVLKPVSGGMYLLEPQSKFPISIISFIKADPQTDKIEMRRYNWMNPDVIEVFGLVNKTKSFNIPISSMRRYFIFNIEQILDETKIKISGIKYASVLTPDNAELLTEISNPAAPAAAPILQDSNNLYSETIYKIAASKKYNSTGTDELAAEMFKDFYQKLGVNTDNIIIKDGCGVSRYNLFSADWMTQALAAMYKQKNFSKYIEYAAQPGEGTLSNRLFDLRGAVRLKTGSLSNLSTITGFIKSADGHTYSTAVLIQNFNKNHSDIKRFEDEIIKIIYNK